MLGVSGSVNPLILGGSVEAAFNLLSNTDQGWFDIFTHPKDFAAAVRAAYVPFDRVRKPSKAKHRFIDYNQVLIGGEYSYLNNAGNQFMNIRKGGYIYPGNGVEPTWYGQELLLDYNYKNGIERVMIHSPYGHINCPYSPLETPSTILENTKYTKQSLPWISDRYVGDSGFRFDAYLLCRESTTLRDLLSDYGVTRDASLGVVVDGVTDTYLNTGYRGMCYGAGEFSKNRLYNDVGGYSADQVLIGSPWIPYPNGITWTGALGDLTQQVTGICFNYETLVMFDGSTFPTNPPLILDRGANLAQSAGICFAESERRITALNALSNQWGNSMEFIAYLGLVSPSTAPLWDAQIPWRLYADPTDAEKVRYYRWRLDASVSHWKEKFKSPIDGFAHVFMDAAQGIERTYHVFGGPTYATKMPVLPSGISYIENTAVSWFRDQHNYTYGLSGPNSEKGLVVGSELFGWYDYVQTASQRYDPFNTRSKKNANDTNIRHWGLDEDIAPAQYQSLYDLVVGQRFAGTTLFNQIYGMGVCGTSTLGEVFAMCRYNDMRTPDGYPFFYGPFIGFSGGQLYWKSIPGNYSGVNADGGIPWHQDRRYKLLYQYPIALALGVTVVDLLHQGGGYYYTGSGWFDLRYGSRIFENDMEARNVGPIVANEPRPNRRTPALPPQNFWTGNARTSEFELLYACMKGGVTGGLDSLGFTNLYDELDAAGATGF